MRGVNKVIIVGNLGNEPEFKAFQNGGSVTHVSVATSEAWKDKLTGEQKEATEWHRVSFFGRLSEIASQYLSKGSKIYVEGKLKTRKWTDQNGVDRYTTEIVAEQLQMLGGGTKQNQGGYPQQGNQGGYPQQGNQGGYPQQGNQGGYPQQGSYPQQPDSQATTYPKNNVQAPQQAPQQAPVPQGNAGQPNIPNSQGFNNQMTTPVPNAGLTKDHPTDDDIPFMYISNQLVGII